MAVAAAWFINGESCVSRDVVTANGDGAAELDEGADGDGGSVGVIGLCFLKLGTTSFLADLSASLVVVSLAVGAVDTAAGTTGVTLASDFF